MNVNYLGPAQSINTATPNLYIKITDWSQKKKKWIFVAAVSSAGWDIFCSRLSFLCLLEANIGSRDAETFHLRYGRILRLVGLLSLRLDMYLFKPQSPVRA